MKKYKSAKDKSTKRLVWGALIASVAFDFLVPSAGIVSFLCKLPFIALLLWVYFGSWYELRGNYVYSIYGPFKMKIYYGRIRKLKLTDNARPSYSLSQRRIAIKYIDRENEKKLLMLSPEDREEFFDELEGRCLNLETNPNFRRLRKIS